MVPVAYSQDPCSRIGMLQCLWSK